MSDLISRSALMSRIESERRQWGEDYDAEQILGDIEDAPAAYDVDKVVEKLEDYLFEKYCVEGDSKIDEIVKGGGVDE